MTETIHEEQGFIRFRGRTETSVPIWVLTHQSLPDGAVRLFGILCMFGGKIFPSCKTLKKLMCCSAKKLYLLTKKLEEAKALTVTRKRKREDGGFTSNTYYLEFEAPSGNRSRMTEPSVMDDCTPTVMDDRTPTVMDDCQLNKSLQDVEVKDVSQDSKGPYVKCPQDLKESTSTSKQSKKEKDVSLESQFPLATAVNKALVNAAPKTKVNVQPLRAIHADTCEHELREYSPAWTPEKLAKLIEWTADNLKDDSDPIGSKIIKSGMTSVYSFCRKLGIIQARYSDSLDAESKKLAKEHAYASLEHVQKPNLTPKGLPGILKRFNAEMEKSGASK